jgi:hypothetical protein
MFFAHIPQQRWSTHSQVDTPRQLSATRRQYRASHGLIILPAIDREGSWILLQAAFGSIEDRGKPIRRFRTNRFIVRQVKMGKEMFLLIGGMTEVQVTVNPHSRRTGTQSFGQMGLLRHYQRHGRRHFLLETTGQSATWIVAFLPRLNGRRFRGQHFLC